MPVFRIARTIRTEKYRCCYLEAATLHEASEKVLGKDRRHLLYDQEVELEDDSGRPLGCPHCGKSSLGKGLRSSCSYEVTSDFELDESDHEGDLYCAQCSTSLTVEEALDAGQDLAHRLILSRRERKT